jgi:uncharacterized repeat protein (TIGR01451 family)
MKKKLKQQSLIVLVFFVFSFLVLSIYETHAAPQIKILGKTSKVFHEWDDGIELVPDATIIYRTTFLNQGTEPAQKVVIKDEIPANTTFVLKSIKASGEIKIEYFDRSINGWVEKAPANPTKILSLRVTFQKNINPAKNNKPIEWLQYAVKVNY